LKQFIPDTLPFLLGKMLKYLRKSCVVSFSLVSNIVDLCLGM
jgi:hypothetical protein